VDDHPLHAQIQRLERCAQRLAQVIGARSCEYGAGAVSEQKAHLGDAAGVYGTIGKEAVSKLFEGIPGLQDLSPTDRHPRIAWVVGTFGVTEEVADGARELATSGCADQRMRVQRQCWAGVRRGSVGQCDVRLPGAEAGVETLTQPTALEPDEAGVWLLGEKKRRQCG
jgi:hypothetical protein